MKKLISLLSMSVILIVSCLVFGSSVSSANDEIMPLANSYIVYQYMDGNTYTTPTFSYISTPSGGTYYSIQGQANGSDVKVYLMDAETGKQMGDTYTLKNGVNSAHSWDWSVNPEHHKFYYKFVKTNLFAFSVFLNLYVLY